MPQTYFMYIINIVFESFVYIRFSLICIRLRRARKRQGYTENMYIVVARSVARHVEHIEKANIENVVLFIWRPRNSRIERCWAFGAGANFCGKIPKIEGRIYSKHHFFGYHRKRTRIFHSILQNNNLLMFAWRLGGLILNDDMFGIWKNVCGTRSFRLTYE